MVRLAHSYPNGAPLVAITGQVGTDRLHIPVVNTMMAKGILPMNDKYSLWTIGIPQKDYVSQLFDRADLVIAIGYDIVECAPAKWAKLCHFYPRSPCGERRKCAVSSAMSNDFYPRSPCGERLHPAPVPRRPHAEFLSTLSLRRATSAGILRR